LEFSKTLQHTPRHTRACRWKDYELALQIGNKDALNAFLAQYPEGFYANLARLQLAKIAAEDTRVAATAKARLAERERARRATEGAQQTQQTNAAAAKAAEAARVAAENAQQAVQQQAGAAEQKRVAFEDAAADKDATEKVGMDDRAADPTPAGKPTAGRPQDTKQDSKVAALSSASAPGLSAVELAKSVQTELRRVGCLTGSVDGEWNRASRRSLERNDGACRPGPCALRSQAALRTWQRHLRSG
jgi:hypothetical protein